MMMMPAGSAPHHRAEEEFHMHALNYAQFNIERFEVALNVGICFSRARRLDAAARQLKMASFHRSLMATPRALEPCSLCAV